MRLAIADPPYLGRAARNYGPAADLSGFGQGRRTLHSGRPRQTLTHPAAADWDDPHTHRNLVVHLRESFDGWAVALASVNLAAYLEWTPPDVRICSWHKPRSVPTGSRVTPSWEPVLVYIPPERRSRASGLSVTDTHTAAPPQTFVGAKPSSWTRWVLDVMGYTEGDHVTDLFPGSGAIQAELNQQVMPLT